MANVLQRIIDRVAGVMSLLGGLLMVALTLVVFASVVSRYFFDLPIRATSELAGLIFAWLVFITAIAVTHREDNIAVTYFRGLLPTPVQKVAKLVTQLIMLGFVIVMLFSSLQLSMAVMNRPLPSLRISSIWLNSSVAVAFVGLALVLLLQLVFTFTGRSTARSDEEAAPDSPDVDPENLQGLE
jgi:TRAP-type transport system small permease protein